MDYFPLYVLNSIYNMISFYVGDDAAVVRSPTSSTSSSPLFTVHSIDFFRSCVSDPFLFGQIITNHALSGDVLMKNITLLKY